MVCIGLGIINLKSEDLGIGIKFMWDIVLFCYRVFYILIFLYIDCDKFKFLKEIIFFIDRNELEIINLEFGKEFCIEVILNSLGIVSFIVSKLIFKMVVNIFIVMIVVVSVGMNKILKVC